VKIPLTRIMRHWRNESFARGIPSSAFNVGLKLWSWVALRPGLYVMTARAAASVMRLAARRGGRLRSLPVLSGWFAVRDLAKPAAQSFQSQWKKRRAGNRP
jgi:L-lactate dehydrogenase complex protein LldF